MTASAPTATSLTQRGRDFLLAFYAALRSLKLYPVENEQVQRALVDLTECGNGLLQSEDELEVRVAGDFLFLNATRLRLELHNYASFSHVLATFRDSGIGVMRIEQPLHPRGWQVFVSALLGFAGNGPDPAALDQLRARLAQAGVEHLSLDGPAQGEDLDTEERRKEVAKITYRRSVGVTRELVNSVRMGRSANIKKVKRAVQGIVDQVLNNEATVVGLTTIRDYDDYTFTHSVNVCIFSVSIGKRLGLNRQQLYDLGMAALLHDIGKSRIPLEILNKQGTFTDDDWRAMRSHPWLGVLAIFDLKGYAEIPYRAMVAAHEHHMKLDLTGYPKTRRPREISMFSKIVTVADVFDAATSRRVYQKQPLQPDAIIQEMWNTAGLVFDGILVKAFINLLGIYPVGTCVILDSYELAIVHGANSDPAQINRPNVRILCSETGVWLDPTPLVNLAETDEQGAFRRSIIKVVDPEKYHITPSDYFV